MGSANFRHEGSGRLPVGFLSHLSAGQQGSQRAGVFRLVQKLTHATIEAEDMSDWFPWFRRPEAG